MADTISGYWDRPLLKNKSHDLLIAGLAMLIVLMALHDAYEVRGKDRPFLLKIMGMPQF